MRFAEKITNNIAGIKTKSTKSAVSFTLNFDPPDLFLFIIRSEKSVIAKITPAHKKKTFTLF